MLELIIKVSNLHFLQVFVALAMTTNVIARAVARGDLMCRRGDCFVVVTPRNDVEVIGSPSKGRVVTKRS